MNQVKAGAALNYVIIGLNIITGLLYTPYMLRCLGQNEYGLYSLVASVIAYLTLLDFGFGSAIVRYTAKIRATGTKQDEWRLYGMFLTAYTVMGLLVTIAGIVLYSNVDAMFDRSMTPAEVSQAKVMMGLMVFNLAVTFPFSVFGSIISAYEHFVFPAHSEYRAHPAEHSRDDCSACHGIQGDSHGGRADGVQSRHACGQSDLLQI